jgi:hypothetical protein
MNAHGICTSPANALRVPGPLFHQRENASVLVPSRLVLRAAAGDFFAGGQPSGDISSFTASRSLSAT